MKSITINRLPLMIAIAAVMNISRGYGQSRPSGAPSGSTIPPGTQIAPIGASPTMSNVPAPPTNGLFTGTNGFPPGFGTNAIRATTNVFVPAGVDGFYRLGSNGFYRRGTNGFYRLAPSGTYEFVPDGNHDYRQGPDGIFRASDDRRGVYRNGVLTTDANSAFDRDDGRGIYRNGVLTPDTNGVVTNGSGPMNGNTGMTNR